MFGPLIQAHSPLEVLYSHRSFSSAPALVPAESRPDPPKSQKFPEASVQPEALLRPPGTLAWAAVPFVPYVPFWLSRFGPPAHDHSPLIVLYFHRSFRNPSAGTESKPVP